MIAVDVEGGENRGKTADECRYELTDIFEL